MEFKVRVMQTIRFMAEPLIALVESERKNMARLVSRNTWKIANTNHLLLLMYFWKRSLYKLQRAVRKFLQVRHARIGVLIKFYNKCMGAASPTSRRASLLSVINITGANTTSLVIKKRIVGDYLRTYLHNFCRENRKKHEYCEKSTFRLYTDTAPMISYFLIASSGMQGPSTRKKSIEFFSGFAKTAKSLMIN